MTVESLQLPVDGQSIGGTLFRQLGSFWNKFFEDRELIRRYCDGNSLIAAQDYLNMLEAASALSRTTVPAFHREIWTPYVVRRSQLTQGTPFTLGMDPPVVLGPQPDGSIYQPNSVFLLGNDTIQQNTVAYPLDPAPNAGGIRIVDDPFTPSVLLTRNVDFYIEGGRLLFPASLDPFTTGAFPTRNVLDDNNEIDQELVIWMADALYDRAFMYDHWGSLLAYREVSAGRYNDVINALFNMRYGGPTISNFRQAIGAIVGVATVGTEPETVETITVDSAGDAIVITDSGVHRLNDREVLAPGVAPGATLAPGRFLSSTVRIYSRPGMLESADKFMAANGWSLDQFILDVPRLRMPRGLLGNYSNDAGLTAVWDDEVPLQFYGYDTNGNPKLRFEMGGTTQNVDIYWQRIWDRNEAAGTSMEALFAPYITDPSYTQVDVGLINPMKFFLQEFIRTDLHIVVVDLDAIPVEAPTLTALQRLPYLLPAHTFMVVIGNDRTPVDTHSLGDSLDPLAVAYAKKLADTADAGLPSTALMTYGNRMTYRWIRV
jgi:hypothetical protein